ncbi:unnamed protein product [Scytosiphon promiscuus]
MLAMSIIEFVACAVLSAGFCLGGVTGQSDTVDEVVLEKFVGRWTKLYGNSVPDRMTTSGLTCVGANYDLDEASGHVAMFNSGRVGSPTGVLQAVAGYAYSTGESEPGQLKVAFPGMPKDGDYWIVGLGPATFGPDGLYEWAIVSDSTADPLSILVRDVEDFEDSYEASVLAFVTDDLGFTGAEKEPQRIVQEGCLPVDSPLAVKKSWEKGEEDAALLIEDVDALQVQAPGSIVRNLYSLEGEDSEDDYSGYYPGDEDGEALIETVDEVDVSKYLGNWTQLYGNTFSEASAIGGLVCVGTFYGFDEPSGNITVFNYGREGTPTGELSSITGYAYVPDEKEPGQLKVALAFVPVDGDYWIAGLGPKTFGSDGLYEWSVVSGPSAESLFLLVRDVERFETCFEESVLAFVTEDLGFTGPEKEPQRIVQEGCPAVDLPDGFV